MDNKSTICCINCTKIEVCKVYEAFIIFTKIFKCSFIIGVDPDAERKANNALEKTLAINCQSYIPEQ